MENFKKLNPISLKSSKLNEGFWSIHSKHVREIMIPYQLEVLNDNIPDAEQSHAIANFRIAAGELKGEFNGLVFQDSDLAKWIESASYSLSTHPDKNLEKTIDNLIDIIEKAQQEDGYLNTYFTIKEPTKRWTNLQDCHELYCAGHMIEAATAYYEATGKRKFLDIMCRFADYIDSVFGVESNKLHGYSGHPEIELALVKLYKSTGNNIYLNLSKYFIDERGSEPNYFVKEWLKRDKLSFWTKTVSHKPETSYYQAHKKVRDQTEAVGHAVRAVYLYSGMADIASETNDTELLNACLTLWNDITLKKMYITGGIGSTSIGEAFTFGYDLPNDTVYAETCASIGLILFAHRLLNISPKAEYADVIEKALLNTVLSSISLDSSRFFYVNPLEVWPEASEKSPIKQHVKSVRQKWFGCACCPPNAARLISSLEQYIYSTNKNSIYTHLFIDSECDALIDGKKIKLKQSTNYPWDGNVKFIVSCDDNSDFNLSIRIPNWCHSHKISINGDEAYPNYKDGYAYIDRAWKNNDIVLLELDMPVEIIEANPNVKADGGKVALQRGPIVYCLEETDNGRNLNSLKLDVNNEFTTEIDNSLFDGCVTIKCHGFRKNEKSFENDLYRTFSKEKSPVSIKAIPYFLWNNRKPGEMIVWINY